MPRSPAFARLKRDLLRLVDAIPAGRLATQQALGAAIDIPPRHVAYLLATLAPAELQAHAWHRVVGTEGRWPHRHAGGEERLASEGLPLQNGRVPGWQARLWTPDAAPQALAALEAPVRPLAWAAVDGDPPLAQARGIGPATVALLTNLGVHTLAQLRAADPLALYAQALALQPRTSINLLYALIGAAEGRDWREVARSERTSLLLALEERGLLRRKP